MSRKLLAGLLVFISALVVSAQKSMTVLGDAWTGKVVTTNDDTREITLRHPDEKKTETFVGVLEEGYTVKMKDGSQLELKVSEIPPDTRVRVFYKTKEQQVSGRKMKVHKIFRIDFLGRDEYTKLRAALKLEPTLPVVSAESDKLPTANPLKIYLAIEMAHVKESLVEWVSKWNKEQAAKYGQLEIVSEPTRADISLVVFWGADETVMALPAAIYDERSGRTRDFYRATAHVVTKEDTGIKVLWQKFLMISAEKLEGSGAVIERELEKRMKARSKALKK